MAMLIAKLLFYLLTSVLLEFPYGTLLPFSQGSTAISILENMWTDDTTNMSSYPFNILTQMYLDVGRQLVYIPKPLTSSNV